MTAQTLVVSTQGQIFLTQGSVDATWHIIQETRAIIGFDRAEKLRFQASYGQQSQQCQHQRAHCQQQLAALQSHRDRCKDTGNTQANQPEGEADTR